MVCQKRMRKTNILKSRWKNQYFEWRISFSCSVPLVFHPKGGLYRKALGMHLWPVAPKAFFPDPHIIHFKPLTVLNKMVSSQRGSLGGPPWDAFLTYRSKSNFSGPPHSPLYAVYSFEQNGSSQKGVLGGRLLGRIFAYRSKSNFSGPPYNPL